MHRTGSVAQRVQGPKCLFEGPRDRGSKGLLADEQEPEGRAPPVAEPVVAEEAPVGIAAQHRDVPAAAAHRGGAEGHDPELPLQLGVGLGEGVRLEVGRGAVAQLVHRGDVRVALGLAVEVLDEHDALARRLVDPGARRVVRPLVVAGEQIRHAVLREPGLEHALVARHVVAHVDAVLTVGERTLDLRADRDHEVRDAALERRLLHDAPEVLHGAALGHDGVGNHLEDFERESEIAEHVTDGLLILLVLSHGRLRFLRLTP